jgi:peptidoglycan/xylan/chitin deacetylase (PgdA/CDA1 family)
MSDEAQAGHRRPRGSPLAADQLQARRAASRRRRTRRRALLGAALATAVILVIVIEGVGGQHGRAPTRAGASVAGLGMRRAHASSTAGELRAERRVLSYTSYIRLGTPHRREIALTFDDGPGPFTPRILGVLKRFHATATFFEIGRQVSVYPRLTARLLAAGMAIGDHTEDHPSLALLSPAGQAAEIDRAAAAIHAAGARGPLLFRPPYGAFDASTLALLRARDMVMVLWTVDTSDYARPGVKRIIYTALSGARPGAILLFHDGGGDRSQTLAALPRIVRRLTERGYRLVTVPQLLEHDPPPVGQLPARSLGGD